MTINNTDSSQRKTLPTLTIDIARQNRSDSDRAGLFLHIEVTVLSGFLVVFRVIPLDLSSLSARLLSRCLRQIPCSDSDS